nr:56 kda actin-sequestering protein, ASP-56=peptide T7a [swine, platelets, Peptide Partial, 7 aa] [Sus scrofa]
HVADDEK